MNVKPLISGYRTNGFAPPVMIRTKLLNGKFQNKENKITTLKRGDRVKISNDFFMDRNSTFGSGPIDLVKTKKHGVRRFDVLESNEGIINEIRQDVMSGKMARAFVSVGSKLVKIDLIHLELIS